MNVYIDCGTHLGEGLKKHIEDFNINQSWKIFTFEANKFTFNLLQDTRSNSNLSSKYQWLKWDNIQYYNKAVWINDGTIDFYCSNTSVSVDEIRTNYETSEFMKMHDKMVLDGDLVMEHQGHSISIDGSSSILPDNFKNYLLNNGNFIQRNLVWDNKINVECFDFSNWLKQNINVDDFVVCKIDIEGAEFEVLKKCISDDTLKLINHLDIEFHHFDNQELNKDYQFIISEIKKLNIIFRTW